MLRVWRARGVSHLLLSAQCRYARGWSEGTPPATLELAMQIHKCLPANGILLNNVPRLLPDELLDGLDVGLKQLFDAHPSLFQMSIGLNLAPIVVPIPQSQRLPRGTIDRLKGILAEQHGCMHVEELFKALPPEERGPIAPFRTLTAALAPLKSDFILEGPLVKLLPTDQDLVIQHHAKTVTPIVKNTPKYIVPLVVAADVNNMSPAEAYRHFRLHQDYFDLVAPPVEPVDLNGPAADVFFAECFVRVLPPYHGFVAPDADARCESHFAQDYDAFRLARFLSTDEDRLISDLGEASGALTKPLVQVIASFPDMFQYDVARQAVRFILRPDYKPDPMDRFTDVEIDEKLQRQRSLLKDVRPAAKFDKKTIKTKIAKYKRAMLIRTRPAGSVFMNPDVLAQFIYDCLPETSAVDMHRIPEMLPEHVTQTTSISLNHWFFHNKPHLFKIFQIKPPNYKVQRADIPFDDALFTTTDGRKFSELEALDIAKEVIKIAAEVPLQHSRPTRWATVSFRLPFFLRQRANEIGWPAIIEAKPECLQRVTVGGSDQWLTFVGEEMEKLLPPPQSSNREEDAPIEEDGPRPFPQIKLPSTSQGSIAGRGWTV